MTIDLDQFFLAHADVVKSSSTLRPQADAAAEAIVAALSSGHKLICMGNGGSASQASHMAGELTGRFKANRDPLPAISLSSDASTVTCISNDYGFESLFERQVKAFAVPGDVVLGLTTSGESENVLRAMRKAKEVGATTIALTGARGLAGCEVDHVLAVPSDVTAHIQELHLMLLHYWCMAIDARFSSSDSATK
jgi:D-sedoheptulose 7-phosphate isomerase